jgi:aspartate/methionine/tyrosine aminotransferase
MPRIVRAPRIPLFEWLTTNASKTKYPLAYSNITGVTYEEFLAFTGFTLPSSYDLGIDHPHGVHELTTALAGIYHCTPENIVTSSGGTEANYLLFSSLLSPGDEVIVEQPGYGPLWLTPQTLGARVVTWPRRFEERFAVNLVTLPSLITKKTKLIVLTNLHNPSGVLLPRQMLQRVADIAAMNHVFLLVDEIFLDGSPTPQPSAYGLPNTIVTSSMSKVYGLGGMRTGWIIAPEHVAYQCQSMKSHTTGASSGLSETLNAKALLTARQAVLDRFRVRTKENLDALKTWMTSNPDIMTWTEPFGGTICFPHYTIDTPSVRLCTEILESTGLLLAPGEYFNLDKHIRLGFGINPVLFQQGLEILQKELRTRMKK